MCLNLSNRVAISIQYLLGLCRYSAITLLAWKEGKLGTILLRLYELLIQILYFFIFYFIFFYFEYIYTFIHL